MKINCGPAPKVGPIAFGPSPIFKDLVFGSAPPTAPIVFGPAPQFNWNSGWNYEDEPVVRLRTSVKKKNVRSIDEPFQPSILQNERIVVE